MRDMTSEKFQMIYEGAHNFYWIWMFEFVFISNKSKICWFPGPQIFQTWKIVLSELVIQLIYMNKCFTIFEKNKSFQINFNNWRYLIQYWCENRNISNINIIEINSWKLFSIQENIITRWCHMPLSSRNNEPEYTMQSECFIRFKKSLKNHHS